MTFPSDATDLVSSWTPDAPPVRSWLLLGGLLPVEYDDVCFVEVEPGRRFLERSRLLSQRVWEHERTIDPTPEGCSLTDRLRFVPRIVLLSRPSAALFHAVFRLRHHNLRRLFGGRTEAPSASRRSGGGLPDQQQRRYEQRPHADGERQEADPERLRGRDV